MAAVVSILRVTTRTRTVWRTCTGCTTLVALAPTETRCEACERPPAASIRRRAA